MADEATLAGSEKAKAIRAAYGQFVEEKNLSHSDAPARIAHIFFEQCAKDAEDGIEPTEISRHDLHKRAQDAYPELTSQAIDKAPSSIGRKLTGFSYLYPTKRPAWRLRFCGPTKSARIGGRARGGDELFIKCSVDRHDATGVPMPHVARLHIDDAQVQLAALIADDFLVDDAPFFGRNEELQVLNDFLTTGSGKGVLVGIPGSGKSALLRTWLRSLPKTTHVVFHRFDRSGDPNLATAHVAYRRLIAELDEHRKRQTRAKSSIDREEPDLAAAATLAIARIATARPLVIVIDAVDECDPGMPSPFLQSLSFTLPDNVFVLVSYSAGSLAERPHYAPLWTLTADCRILLAPLATHDAFAWASSILGTSRAALLTGVVETSRGHALYMSTILDDLRDADNRGEDPSRQLASAPATFREYIGQQFRSLVNMTDTRVSSILEVLSYLSVAFGPVPLTDLEVLSSIRPADIDTAPASIRRWIAIDTDDDGRVWCAIAPELARSEFRYQLGSSRITKATQLLLEYSQLWASHHSPYALRHLDAHLRAERRSDDLCALVDDHRFWQTRSAALPFGPELELQSLRATADYLLAFGLHKPALSVMLRHALLARSLRFPSQTPDVRDVATFRRTADDRHHLYLVATGLWFHRDNADVSRTLITDLALSSDGTANNLVVWALSQNTALSADEVFASTRATTSVYWQIALLRRLAEDRTDLQPILSIGRKHFHTGARQRVAQLYRTVARLAAARDDWALTDETLNLLEDVDDPFTHAEALADIVANLAERRQPQATVYNDRLRAFAKTAFRPGTATHFDLRWQITRAQAAIVIMQAETGDPSWHATYAETYRDTSDAPVRLRFRGETLAVLAALEGHLNNPSKARLNLSSLLQVAEVLTRRSDGAREAALLYTRCASIANDLALLPLRDRAIGLAFQSLRAIPERSARSEVHRDVAYAMTRWLTTTDLGDAWKHRPMRFGIIAGLAEQGRLEEAISLIDDRDSNAVHYWATLLPELKVANGTARDSAASSLLSSITARRERAIGQQTLPFLRYAIRGFVRLGQIRQARRVITALLGTSLPIMRPYAMYLIRIADTVYDVDHSRLAFAILFHVRRHFAVNPRHAGWILARIAESIFRRGLSAPGWRFLREAKSRASALKDVSHRATMFADIARIACQFDDARQYGIDLFVSALALADTLALPNTRFGLLTEIDRNRAEARVIPESELSTLPLTALRTARALEFAEERRYGDARSTARLITNESSRGETLREVGLIAAARGDSAIATDIVKELRVISPKDAPRVIEALIDVRPALKLAEIAEMCFGDVGLAMLAMGAIVDRHPELAAEAAALVSDL